jgi:hypothetical protein
MVTGAFERLFVVPMVEPGRELTSPMPTGARERPGFEVDSAWAGSRALADSRDARPMPRARGRALVGRREGMGETHSLHVLSWLAE